MFIQVSHSQVALLDLLQALRDWRAFASASWTLVIASTSSPSTFVSCVIETYLLPPPRLQKIADRVRCLGDWKCQLLVFRLRLSRLQTCSVQVQLGLGELPTMRHL